MKKLISAVETAVVAIQIAFAMLRMFLIVEWSWWIVLSPIMLYIFLIIVIVILTKLLIFINRTKQ